LTTICNLEKLHLHCKRITQQHIFRKGPSVSITIPLTVPFPATVVVDEFSTLVVFKTLVSAETVLLVFVELVVAALLIVSTGVDVVVVLSKNLSKAPTLVEFELIVVRD
jgi:hypothetical protein